MSRREVAVNRRRVGSHSQWTQDYSPNPHENCAKMGEFTQKTGGSPCGELRFLSSAAEILLITFFFPYHFSHLCLFLASTARAFHILQHKFSLLSSKHVRRMESSQRMIEWLKIGVDDFSVGASSQGSAQSLKTIRAHHIAHHQFLSGLPILTKNYSCYSIFDWGRAIDNDRSCRRLIWFMSLDTFGQWYDAASRCVPCEWVLRG